ncbi:MAG: TIM barrel protein [Patescibacteria group bacterium]
MLRFHSPGIPTPAKPKGILAGLDYIKQYGLDGMEVLFTHGVNMSSALASAVKQKAQNLDLTLTVHGPYWINFNSLDKSKFEASIERVINTIIKGHELGAKSITFHPAFTHGDSPEVVTSRVVTGLRDVISKLDYTDTLDVLIAPETTGKPTQFGSVDDILAVSTAFNKQTSICVDFSHYYARTNGKENGKKSFQQTLNKISGSLGVSALKNLHIHISGIIYSEKGEIKHRTLKEETEFEWKTLLQVLKENDVSGWVSVETPDIEISAKIAKDYYHSL